MAFQKTCCKNSVVNVGAADDGHCNFYALLSRQSHPARQYHQQKVNVHVIICKMTSGTKKVIVLNVNVKSI